MLLGPLPRPDVVGRHRTGQRQFQSQRGGPDRRWRRWPAAVRVAAGYQAGDIDTVFLTHLHPDHVGWNVTRPGEIGGIESPTFPNARYVAHEADWAAFDTPRDSEIFGYDWWAQTVAPLRRLGVLDLITGETELTGELT
ncbi:MAG: MBL fold metallo-hydrolase, partial [Chloroflexi bacterium]|nr:MBL fold metallo-hydrolase [Chloroflexota bacterium]